MSANYDNERLLIKYLETIKQTSFEFKKTPEEIVDLLSIKEFKRFVNTFGIDSWNLKVISRFHLSMKI